MDDLGSNPVRHKRPFSSPKCPDHSVAHPSSHSVSTGDSSHHLMPRLSISGTTCPVPLYGVQKDNFYLFIQRIMYCRQHTQTHHSVPELQACL
jgi:hypothetical protein